MKTRTIITALTSGILFAGCASNGSRPMPADTATRSVPTTHANPVSEPLPATTEVLPADVVKKITAAAAASQVSKSFWRDRDYAPAGYTKGMALVYAKTYARWKSGDPYAVAMAKAARVGDSQDSLSVFAPIFQEKGMSNLQDGVDTLRHVFVLLMGMGMYESSGRWCEGRDVNAENYNAETAEAGVFQSSWNVRPAHQLLLPIYQWYRDNPSGMLTVFKEGVTPLQKELGSHGDGEGAKFQLFTKQNPAFAAEFAAIAIRHRAQDFAAVNKIEGWELKKFRVVKRSEVKAAADTLFREVQRIVDDAGVVLPPRPLR